MMSGIIGSILGFGSSVVPAITDHFKSKRNMEFELKKMEKMTLHMIELNKRVEQLEKENKALKEVNSGN